MALGFRLWFRGWGKRSNFDGNRVWLWTACEEVRAQLGGSVGGGGIDMKKEEQEGRGVQ